MKVLVKCIGWVSIVGVSLLFPSYSGAEPLGSMRISLLRGDVQVKIADTGEWAPASVNMPLVEGDELWIPEGSRAALQTNHGAHVRLDANTALQVLRMDRDSFQFYLAQGDAYVLNRAPKRSVLQLDTPDASIRAFGGSTFRVEVPDGETDVSVYKGSVLAENAGGTTRVRAGDMVALGADGFAELSPLPPPDDWQRWNMQWDRAVLARRESYRHLPEELRVYSSDFDDSGRWVNVPEYGYCWTPTVVVINDWAPYRHGRWVWRGGDYVWVGYEPWGWAPYHYGRWTFVPNIGWLWVPPARGDVFWAPGYVGWVRTGDHVAWVPLAPREVYYGRGNYGRYSTNITNVNITQVQVTNVYRNVNVANSVTVVHQSTFLTGRPSSVDRNVVVNVREDFAKRRNLVVGRPPIQPVEASRHPVVRSIPEAKRPPERVRKIDAKELKQSRPLVTEPDRSALRPQAAPRPMEVRKMEKPRTARERAMERPAGQGREIDRGRPREAPVERGKPEAQPERGKAVAPKDGAGPAVEKGRPQQAPKEQERAMPPGRRDREIDRGRPREAPVERGMPREAPVERGKPEAQPERGKAVAPKDGAGPAVEKGRPQQAPKEQERAMPPGRRDRDKPKPSYDNTRNSDDKEKPQQPPGREDRGRGR